MSEKISDALFQSLSLFEQKENKTNHFSFEQEVLSYSCSVLELCCLKNHSIYLTHNETENTANVVVGVQPRQFSLIPSHAVLFT